jgi:hypothetical protein
MLIFADIAAIRINPLLAKYRFFNKNKDKTKKNIGTKSFNPKIYVPINTTGESQYRYKISNSRLANNLNKVIVKKISIKNKVNP